MTIMNENTQPPRLPKSFSMMKIMMIIMDKVFVTRMMGISVDLPYPLLVPIILYLLMTNINRHSYERK